MTLRAALLGAALLGASLIAAPALAQAPPQPASPAAKPPQATAPQTGSPPTGTPQPAPPGGPQSWAPRPGAQLQALDKVNAKHQSLDVPVGGKTTFGSLTITVERCVVHGPDQPKEAAAFLVITDQHPGTQSFHGWMFASDPSVSMLEHPIYDVRVTGCTG